MAAAIALAGALLQHPCLAAQKGTALVKKLPHTSRTRPCSHISSGSLSCVVCPAVMSTEGTLQPWKSAMTLLAVLIMHVCGRGYAADRYGSASRPVRPYDRGAAPAGRPLR